jgi:adiponectin receptor
MQYRRAHCIPYRVFNKCAWRHYGCFLGLVWSEREQGLYRSIFLSAIRVDDICLQKWRVAFFLSTSVLMLFSPLAHLALLYSFRETFAFIRASLYFPPCYSTIADFLTDVGPIIPSLMSYIVGLIFYATRFPECILPTNTPRLAWLGGGSHALWHLFIVWAISLHRNALPALKYGVSGAVSGVCPVPAA